MLHWEPECLRESRRPECRLASHRAGQNFSEHLHTPGQKI